MQVTVEDLIRGMVIQSGNAASVALAEHVAGSEEAFAAHPRTAGMELIFPLWGADYEELLKELESSGARCVISAIAADLPGISVSDSYDAALIDKLPQGVDRFGENGEFHTRIIV